jgi:hypothetical protein
MNLRDLYIKLVDLHNKMNQKSHLKNSGDLFDGECPHGDSNSLLQIDPKTEYWTQTYNLQTDQNT